MKRFLSIITLIIVLCVFGASAAGDAQASTITIGMMSSLDVIPYVLIHELGLDAQYGFTLNLETFTSARDRDAAFQVGELDGVLTDYIGVCIYQNAGFDVRITGITDGDYILMAGKDTGITELSQVRGRSIAISENTLIEYTLDKILEHNGMAGADVDKQVVPRIPDRLELLRSGQIDLGLMPEPFATLGLSGGAVQLATANEYGLYPAVSAFSMQAISSKEQAIQNLYKAYNEAVSYMNQTDIGAYEALVIQTVGYPADMAGHIELKPFRMSTLPPLSDVQEAVAWASAKGLCSPDLSYDQLTYNVY